MTDERKNAANTYTDETGKFAEGNPGKPKGARHKTTRAVEEQRDTAHNAFASLIHMDFQDNGHRVESRRLDPTTPLFTLPQLPPRDTFEAGLSEHPSLRILSTKHGLGIRTQFFVFRESFT